LWQTLPTPFPWCGYIIPPTVLPKLLKNSPTFKRKFAAPNKQRLPQKAGRKPLVENPRFPLKGAFQPGKKTILPPVKQYFLCWLPPIQPSPNSFPARIITLYKWGKQRTLVSFLLIG